IVSGAQSLGIYDDILASQRETAHETAVMIGENVARPVITSIARMISSIIIFILLMFVFKLVVRAVNKVFKLPVIHGLNVFLGGALGVAKGIIVLIVACFAISLLMMFSDGSFLIFTPDNIEKTYLFKMIYNINPFIF
ncbi:MAG: CvpA family protein, partial [Clostridia bacterium]|nr:CvpA family protein [Clostridia bacterium]